jgi:hypothetical protein
VSENDATNAQPRPRSRRGPRLLRITLRCCRIFLLLILFVAVTALFFLNKIGLPDFVKERMMQELRAHGWEGEFSRVRLRWDRGIVADDVHLRRATNLHGPHLFVQEAECGLNFGALKDFRLEVRSFKMTNARIIWLLARGREAQPPFTLNNAAAELSFERNDTWDLRFLDGELLGTRVHLTGRIANGSLIRDWRAGQKRRPGPRRDPLALWEDIVRVATRLRFEAQPELDGAFRGDAADFRSFEGNLRFRVPGLNSPWGSATNVLLTTRLLPPGSNSIVQADVALTATEVITPTVRGRDVRLNLEFEPQFTNAWPTNVNLAVELKDVRSRWATGNYALITTRLAPCPTNFSFAQSDVRAMVKQFQCPELSAETANLRFTMTHPYTNWQPGLISGSGELEKPATQYGRAAETAVEFSAQIPEAAEWSLLNTNLNWPDRARTLPLQASLRLRNLAVTNAQAEGLAAQVQWNWPLLNVNANGALYGGEFKAETRANVASGDLTFTGESTFDVHRIEPFLSANAQKFLRSYGWEKPPHLRAAGHLKLPPWTNTLPHFDDKMLEGLSLAGFFDVGRGAYKEITFNSAQSPFTFTNNVWRIDNLVLKRPEGSLVGVYTSKPATKEFHWKLQSTIDPQALKPLFKKEAERRVFEFFEFTDPPGVEGEVWGDWRRPERTAVSARMVARELKFRGETVEECAATVSYTNSFIGIVNPTVRRAGGEKGTAPGVGIDVKQQRIWITNAFGNVDPHVVARCIGRKTGRILEEYVFDLPPTTRVNGSVDLRKGSDEDDLHFEISGGAFHWKDFRFQQISGNIDWVGRTMTLTNMQGIFHGGRAMGNAYFVFPRKQGADFSFKLSVAEVDFHSLMLDLSRKTNQLEGMLNGELIVVSANTDQPKSWMGYGHVHLRDGLIWEIPVFGIFSPILNAIMPGLGNSRAKQGFGEFLITNSVISTKDLDIQATAMRMHFRGTVDFDKRIVSKVEAELLRDLPGVGLILSKILWPVTKVFEYELTGTLAQPKAEPLYIIPKVLLLPLQPFKVLKDIVIQDSEGAKPPE